jgi:hypothetical protein
MPIAHRPPGPTCHIPSLAHSPTRVACRRATSGCRVRVITIADRSHSTPRADAPPATGQTPPPLSFPRSFTRMLLQKLLMPLSFHFRMRPPPPLFHFNTPDSTLDSRHPYLMAGDLLSSPDFSEPPLVL